jgi:hypothetical protein
MSLEEAESYIAAIRQLYPAVPDPALLDPFAHHPPDRDGLDAHSAFRRAVCRALLSDFGPPDRGFIRYLLEQEIACAASHRNGVGYGQVWAV